jgi:nucleoside-diphosphate-sugar epimerase
VRPFNTYGPRQSARAVVPTIVAQALTQSVVYLGNLNARRDLTFVSDTIEGFVRAGETPGIEGEIFNLGSGTEIRIGNLAEEIISLIGRPVRVEVDPARMRPEKSEVERLLSDNRLAQQRLGWKPQVPLHEGLGKTIEWIATHLDRYRPREYAI